MSTRSGTTSGSGGKADQRRLWKRISRFCPEESAGYVDLLFSAGALRDGGTFEAILDASRDHAAELGARLRERIYSEAVPALAGALADRHDGEPDEAALAGIYEQALVVLFRLLFVAYAEDKDLLPYRTNGVYRENALKTLARELAERRAGGQTRLRRERGRSMGTTSSCFGWPLTEETSNAASPLTTVASSRANPA